MRLRSLCYVLILFFGAASVAAQDMETTSKAQSYMPASGWIQRYLTHDEITYYTGQYVLNTDTTVTLLVDLGEDHLQLVMPNGDEYDMIPAGQSVFYFDSQAPDRLYFYRDHWRDPWRMNILTTGGKELEAIQTNDEDY